MASSFGPETTGIDVVKQLRSQVDGKTILITGTSEGSFGAEVAVALAHADPKLIVLASRTEAKVSPVMDNVKNCNPNTKVCFVNLDLMDLSSVRAAAAEVKKITDHVDILINCAGIMAIKTYTLSKDRIESQFAVNHIGHFLLTGLLMPQILKAAGDGSGATIVNVSSLGYQLGEVNFADVNFQEGKSYHPWRAYGQSKTANILFTYELAKRLAKRNIAVLTLQPGVSMETHLFASSGVDNELLAEAYQMAIDANDGKPLPPQVTVTAQQGAGRILVAALSPATREAAPAFLDENKISAVKEYATREDYGARLWDLSEELVGQKFDI